MVYRWLMGGGKESEKGGVRLLGACFIMYGNFLFTNRADCFGFDLLGALEAVNGVSRGIVLNNREILSRLLSDSNKGRICVCCLNTYLGISDTKIRGGSHSFQM